MVRRLRYVRYVPLFWLATRSLGTPVAAPATPAPAAPSVVPEATLEARVEFESKPLTGLTWVRTQSNVNRRTRGKLIESSATFEGRFERVGWNLVRGPRTLVASDASKREFMLAVSLKADKSSLELKAVGPRGEVETAKVLVFAPGLSALNQSGAPAIKAAGAVAVARTSSLAISFGASSIQYRETRVPDLSLMVVTGKLGYTAPVFTPAWSVGASVYGTLLPLSTSVAGQTARFVGANARFGYSPPFVPAPFRLSLLAGVSYARMFVTGNAFGYGDTIFPQLFPTLRYAPRDAWALNAYLKYVPMDERFSLVSVERELAFGVSADFRALLPVPVSIAFDHADFRIHPSSRRTIESTSESVSLGVSF